jgi:nicotinate-nucleotide adenylyltransferase
VLPPDIVIIHPESGMREGILGGSFDPIHNGHLHVAEECRTRLLLDRVLFVPACVPPHKQNLPLTDARHRLEMVRLAIAGIVGFEVSDEELRRTGPSYTVDTVSAELARLGKGAEIFFLMGADQALELHLWHNVRELARRCTLVPVTRPGFALDRLDELKTRLSAGIVRQLKSAALDIPPVDVSSTEIRRRVRAGIDISQFVPPPVEQYIRQHQLYL